MEIHVRKLKQRIAHVTCRLFFARVQCSVIYFGIKLSVKSHARVAPLNGTN